MVEGMRMQGKATWNTAQHRCHGNGQHLPPAMSSLSHPSYFVSWHVLLVVIQIHTKKIQATFDLFGYIYAVMHCSVCIVEEQCFMSYCSERSVLLILVLGLQRGHIDAITISTGGLHNNVKTHIPSINQAIVLISVWLRQERNELWLFFLRPLTG